MTTVTTTMARFSISGAHITEHARTLMEEGDWKVALNYLKQALGTITYDQSISILDGQTKLVGADDNITLEPEDPSVRTELLEAYSEVYETSGLIKHNGQLYRPYLVINNLGWNDVIKVPEAPSDVLAPLWRTECEFVHEKTCYPKVYSIADVEWRAHFYAHQPEADLARVVKDATDKHVVALFTPVNDASVPFWMLPETTSFQEAYNQCRSYLPKHGHAQEFNHGMPETKKCSLLPVVIDEQAIAETLAAELKHEAMLDQRFLQESEKIRKLVVEFADNDKEYGWRTFKWKSDKFPGKYLTIRAPGRALICYALSRTSAANHMPAYQSKSPPDFKMPDDNPYHTDVWLGCGFSLDSVSYHGQSMEYMALLDLMFEVQKEMLNFEVQVLASAPAFSGSIVFHDSPEITKENVLVLPHAGVEFELQALKAGGIICAVGGKLAHLVTVYREIERPIMRMDNALTAFKEGQLVELVSKEGRVVLHPEYRRNY